MVTVNIELKVNGKMYKTAVSASECLSSVLRNRLHLTGTKEGCHTGSCGACTVLVDRRAVKSCLYWAVLADGKEILTIEGLSLPDHPLHPIQQAFVDAGAIQCGYCTPGFIMSVYQLLSENPHPDDQQIRAELAGNICRCTGYETIIQAVKLAASRWDAGNC